MVLVMNEYQLAEDILNGLPHGCSLGESMVLLAKYYKKNGGNKRSVSAKLKKYALEHNATATETAISASVEYAVKQAWKYDIVMIEKIDVSVQEMSRIGALKSVQARKLAFTLLCIAKYWDEVSSVAEHWINSPDSYIVSSACITSSTKRQDELFKELYDAGMIDYAKRVDNLHVRVLFMESGETAVSIRDLRNLGYQYLALSGDSQWFLCENCGVTVRKAKSDFGRPQKYCKACAEEVNRIKTIARMKTLREGCKILPV